MATWQRRGHAAALASAAALTVGVSSCGSAQSTGALGPSAKALATSPTPAHSRSDPAAAGQYQSPEHATLSWFYAVNHKDRAAAIAHFTAFSAGLMDWGGGDTSTWPTFSGLHCRPLSQAAATATVYCTFTESQAPATGNPDSFWYVGLQRQWDGRWLITNYGVG